MLKLEKNLFFERVETSRLDPSLFAAEDVQPGRLGDARYSSGLGITLLGTDLAFRAMKFENTFDGKDYRCATRTFDPASERISDEFEDRHWRGEYNMPVADAARCFGAWLTSDVALYFAERDAVDLWRQLDEVRSLTRPGLEDEVRNGYFTEAQKEYLRTEAVPRIRVYIVERFDLNEDVLARMDERLAYLIEAVDRPKFDFRALLIDFGLAVATTLLLSKEDGTALFQFIADVMTSAGRLLSGL
jgi:hypothetical protein